MKTEVISGICSTCCWKFLCQHRKGRLPFHVLWQVFLWVICSCSMLTAQSFLKSLDHQDLSLGRKITSFANGDVLIGDSSIEGLRDVSLDGKIYLTRLDACGSVIWSNTYHQKGVYLEFKDFKINDVGEVFVFGSAYQNNFEELIYLLKVLPDGQMERFNLFRTGTVDHFSYTIDVKDGMVMCYGLLLDFGTQKQGFVSVFDEALNFNWGVKFAPFETGGEAIFTSSGNIMCRSDAFLINLDGDGQLNWARELNVSDVGVPIAGPFELADGFIFQGYQAGQTFFYKVNQQGDLLWTSDQILSTEHPADFLLTDERDVLVSFSSPINGENRLAQCLLSNNGDIKTLRFLDVDLPMDVGSSSSVFIDRKVTIVANGSIYNTNDGHAGLNDFILQYSLDTLETDCFSWRSFDAFSANDKILMLVEYDTAILSNEMTLDLSSQSYMMPASTEYLPSCDSNTLRQDQLIDTILGCDEAWQVTLPPMGFFWEDGYAEQNRVMQKAGVYRARNGNCSNPIVLSYELQRPDCRCNVYLPSAISPNTDGVNDELKLFSDCTFTSWEIRVYNRWGEQIHFSTSSTSGWDGSFGSDFVAPGLVVVQADYRLIGDDGVEQKGTLYQELQVIR